MPIREDRFSVFFWRWMPCAALMGETFEFMLASLSGGAMSFLKQKACQTWIFVQTVPCTWPPANLPALLIVPLIAVAQTTACGMFVGHLLFLPRFRSCKVGLVALRQGVEGLELVALLKPALLTLGGLVA